MSPGSLCSPVLAGVRRAGGGVSAVQRVRVDVRLRPDSHAQGQHRLDDDMDLHRADHPNHSNSR